MRNQIKNLGKMGGLRKGNLCLSTLHTGCTFRRKSKRPFMANFASAHFIRAAPWHSRGVRRYDALCLSTLHTGCTASDHIPAAVERILCLSTLHTGCTLALAPATSSTTTLPQHTSYGLHPATYSAGSAASSFASAHFIRAAPVTAEFLCLN